MSKTDATLPDCPVGETSCEWLDEIVNLRNQLEELSSLMSTDVLTGLYNFRHFNMLLQSEMDRSKRSGIPTSLVLIDVDHFKAVNDTYGHEKGDLALKYLAYILRDEVRTTDIVCRYGGAEFAIIFPETHLNLAVKVADRIRKKVASRPIPIENGDIELTVSMGASVYMKTSVLDHEDFVASVDKYLDEARQSGRNCICHIDYSDLRAVTEVGADERAMLLNFE